jgi:hypothetical protein
MDLKIAFCTKNTIGNLLMHKNSLDRQTDIYSLPGAYKLCCPDYNKAYVRQTGRQFSTMYKEHKTAFRNNNQACTFAKHLGDAAHFFGPMNEIMQVLHCHRKGLHLNMIERFHIHAEAIDNNHLSDEHTIFPNAIFDTLLRSNRPFPSLTMDVLTPLTILCVMHAYLAFLHRSNHEASTLD